MEPLQKEDVIDEKEPEKPTPYGLKEIFNLVYMGNSWISKLALGTDLTSLGLDVIAPEALHPSLTSLLKDVKPPKDSVEFNLPACYYMNTPTLKLFHLKRFTAETLFYIFYTIVCDMWQSYAAIELYNRGWTYHTDWKKWFFYNHQVNNESSDIWTYFEPSLWTKKSFNKQIDPAHFLKNETLRSLLNDQSSYILLSENTGDMFSNSSKSMDLNKNANQDAVLGNIDLSQLGNVCGNSCNSAFAQESPLSQSFHVNSTKDNLSQMAMYDTLTRPSNSYPNMMGLDKKHMNFPNTLNLCKSSNNNSIGGNPHPKMFFPHQFSAEKYNSMAPQAASASRGYTTSGIATNNATSSPSNNGRDPNTTYKIPHSPSLEFLSKQNYHPQQPTSCPQSQTDTYQLLIKSLSEYHHQSMPPNETKKNSNVSPVNLLMNTVLSKQQQQPGLQQQVLQQQVLQQQGLQQQHFTVPYLQQPFNYSDDINKQLQHMRFSIYSDNNNNNNNYSKSNIDNLTKSSSLFERQQ